MSDLYITTDELKDTLEIESSETYAEADIEMACAGASEIIRGYKQTLYHPATQTRVYSPPTREYTAGALCVQPRLAIDDLGTLGTLSVDLDGDGTYETVWTQGSQFWLEPINAATDGVPYDSVVLRPQSGAIWPTYPHSIQIQGVFGYLTTPNRVRQAAKILAARLLKRARETPYGIVTVVGEAVAAARLGRIDPDVAASLDNEFGLSEQPFA